MGPSSMLFGRGSTGGVINQVTKKPGLKQATELSGQVTTNGLIRTTADVNTPFGENNAARVNGMFQWGKALRPSTTPTSWTLAWHPRSSSASARRPRSRWAPSCSTARTTLTTACRRSAASRSTCRATSITAWSTTTPAGRHPAQCDGRSQVQRRRRFPQPERIPVGEHLGPPDLGRLRRHPAVRTSTSSRRPPARTTRRTAARRSTSCRSASSAATATSTTSRSRTRASSRPSSSPGRSAICC